MHTRAERLRGLLAELGEGALALVYPPRCGACDGRLARAAAGPLCASCAAESPRFGAQVCLRCGDAVGPYANTEGGCGSCRTRPSAFRGAAAVAAYEGPWRRALLAMKLAGRHDLAAAFAAALARRVAEVEFARPPEVLAAVPMTAAERAKRAFDPVAALGKISARALALHWRPRALTKTRETQPQRMLPATRRAGNVRGAFACGDAPAVAGRCVLLVDDVLTTGATASECARALKEAGASAVWVAVLARARR